MRYKSALVFIVCFLLLLFIPNINIVKASVSPPFGTIPVNTDSSLPNCSDPSKCQDVGATCNNGPSNTDDGGCGGSACGDGDSWSKYRITCKQTAYDPILGERCGEFLEKTLETVCSTADKCDDGGGGVLPGYLRAGLCECGIGGTNKICCAGGSMANQCEQTGEDTHNPLWEGICPAGYSAVQCGEAGQPACDASACGAPPSEPPPPDTPPPDIPPPDIPPPVCVANSWDSTRCATCKADGTGWSADCTNFGTNSPSPGNDWCSCDQRCPGIDNPACTPTSSFVTQAPIQWLPPTCSGDSFSGCTLE